MAEKFVPFDDAAKELQMSADELKGLMDEGKIRHFMDGGKIKFRRGDLDELKSSLGIQNAEEEISLAPPENVLDLPSFDAEADEELPPPPPAAEEDFSIEPLDDAPAHAPAGPKGAPKAAEKEEEIASLSDFEITGDVEEEGQELSGDEAELLAIQSPIRGYDEPKAANVGMSVLLIVAVIVLAFGAAVLLSFPAEMNPFKSLTDLFAAK